MMKLYRFEDRVYSTVSISVSGMESYGVTPVQLECTTYEVLRETRCGWTVSVCFNNKRWVKKVNHNYGFAYPTKQAALVSFIVRKEAQMRLLGRRMQRVERAHALAKLELCKQMKNL